MYDGFYYAINNSSLQIYKKLEKFGIITHVQADILPLETIPAAIRESLFIYGNFVAIYEKNYVFLH
jgi:hypothetical protein